MKRNAGITSDDVRFALTSLEFTREKFREYPYLTEEIRVGRMADVEHVIERMRWLRDFLKERERKGW